MDLHQALKEELALPLPGLDYQLKMAPMYRKLNNESDVIQNAAIAIIIFLSIKKEWEIILTKRAEYNGHHSGQVSFPGGKAESNDENLLQTAIRETNEEIGIQLTVDHYLGIITSLFIPVSQFMVFPYVFLKRTNCHFIIDPSEVDYVIQFPLMGLLDKSLIKSTQIQVRNRTTITPYYAIEGEMVWGATAMILSEFIEILNRVDKKNPGLL